MRTLHSAGIVAGVLLLANAGTAFQEKAPRLPYKSIDNPEFIPTSAAGFLSDADRLIGIATGSTVRAYPAAILAQHGVVLDQMPDGPIAVTW